MHPNPYGADLGDRDPLEAFADTPSRIRQLVERWGEDRFERSYAPGKWSARQVLVHLVQTELALGTRIRFALTEAATGRRRSSRTRGCRSTPRSTRAPRSTCTPHCGG